MGHFAGLRQDRLAALEVFFHAFALRDVAGDVDGAQNLSVWVEEWSARDEEVPAEMLLVDLHTMLAGIRQGLVVRTEGRRCVQTMDELIAQEPGALLRSHAQSLGHRAVGTHDSVLEIDNGDEVRTASNVRSHSCLASSCCWSAGLSATSPASCWAPGRAAWSVDGWVCGRRFGPMRLSRGCGLFVFLPSASSITMAS